MLSAATRITTVYFMPEWWLHRRGHAKSGSNSGRIAYSANPMSFVEELTWRGLVQQSTDPELAAKMRAEPFTLYIGFDPTADSLHVGSLCRY